MDSLPEWGTANQFGRLSMLGWVAGVFLNNSWGNSYLMGRTESPTDFAKISGNRREFLFVDSRFVDSLSHLTWNLRYYSIKYSWLINVKGVKGSCPLQGYFSPLVLEIHVLVSWHVWPSTPKTFPSLTFWIDFCGIPEYPVQLNHAITSEVLTTLNAKRHPLKRVRWVKSRFKVSWNLENGCHSHFQPSHFVQKHASKSVFPVLGDSIVSSTMLNLFGANFPCKFI